MSKIFVISEKYWPDGSGGELATHLILSVLKKKFNIIVVTGTKNPSRVSDVKYIYEPLLSRQEKPVLWLNILRFVNTQKFQKLLLESDIVYIPRFTFPIIPFAKKLDKKVVVHLHGYILISYTSTVLAPYEEHKHSIILDDIKLECMRSFKHCMGANLIWWLPKLARKWISQADKVACVSRRQAEIIADQAPELRDKIEVVYNPLPPEIINAELRKELDDIPTFLYVGGDSYVKGFYILLQALNKLGKQGIKAKFILINKYSPRNFQILKILSEKYRNLEVQILGRVEHNKLIELYKRTWSLLFPSIWEETFGYAVVEASMFGTIAIASKAGGVAELLIDTFAHQFMVSPGSVDDLVKKISKVSSLGINEVKSLGFKQREKILQKLDPNKIEKKIIEIFEESQRN
jgi:glycosyltransferase involved in cell wall biosynthesis